MLDGRPRKYQNFWAELGTAAFQIVVGVYAGLVLQQPLLRQFLIIMGALALVAAILTIRDPGNPPNWGAIKIFVELLVSIQLGAFRWLARAAPGVAVTVMVFFGWPRISSIGDPCGFSTELRVVTGPENVTAVKAAADRYVAERSGDGCRNATIAVTANSSITGLRLGFANGWLKPGASPGSFGSSGSAPQQVSFIGPRPDIWIPDSQFAADHVLDYVEEQSAAPDPLTSKARLHRDGTVGISPTVVGVFTEHDRPGPSHDKLQPLLTRLRIELGVQALVRPSPDASEAALLATPVLYQALSEGGNPWVRSDAEAEKLLNTRGRIPGDPTALQTSDAAALLCRFRAAEARDEPPPPDIAVVASEKVIAAYNQGDNLGTETACQGGGRPAQRWRLSVYHTNDLPVLDHPFIQVRWPGEYTDRRQHAIDDFRDWLGEDALTMSGFRTGSGKIAPPEGTNPLLQGLQEGGGGKRPETVEPRRPSGRAGCAGTLQDALDCYVAARPVTSLSLLIDVSGSMVQLAGPEGERSLLRAQQVAEGIVSGARTRDQIRVRTFSTERPPAMGPPTTIFGDEERAALHAQIQQVALAGSDMRLTEAIEAATRELTAGTQNLVVLTDGQVPRSNRGVAGDAPELADRLRDENRSLRIFIVLIGPKTCAEQPVKPLADALGTGSCVDGSAVPTEDIADSVISTILWGDL